MGGMPPLGYDVKDRKLVVNEDEARTVERLTPTHAVKKGTRLTVHEVASEELVSPAYVYSILRLSSLAPDIVVAIVNGRNPLQLTAEKLMRLSPHLPIGWTEQCKLLGLS